MNSKLKLIAFVLFALTAGFSGCKVFWSAGFSNITTDGGSSDITSNELITRARYAQKLSEAGMDDEAIAQYRLHITERLKDPSRPADENPYFYEILIGDIYLRQDKPVEAEDCFNIAREKQVAAPFIIDRMRQLGAWYENHNQLETARDTLKRYRELDTLLFDFDIDRIGKKIVAADEQNLPQ